LVALLLASIASFFGTGLGLSFWISIRSIRKSKLLIQQIQRPSQTLEIFPIFLVGHFLNLYE
jgi:hypothetical protein